MLSKAKVKTSRHWW